MINNYKQISSLIYNFTKPPGTSIDGDLEFYKEKLLPIEGKILEAGVGNGRLLIPLLKYKIDIEGIDKSNDMINICNANLEKENLKTKLFISDLENFYENNKYEFIIFPNGGFNLIESRIKANNILKNFYKLLISKGKIIIDLIFPTDFKAGSIHKFNHFINGKEIKVKNYSKEINWIKQYTINELEYFINGELVEKQNMKLLWYGKNEFIHILNSIGFKEKEIIANFNKKRNLNLKTLTFIFEK